MMPMGGSERGERGNQGGKGHREQRAEHEDEEPRSPRTGSRSRRPLESLLRLRRTARPGPRARPRRRWPSPAWAVTFETNVLRRRAGRDLDRAAGRAMTLANATLARAGRSARPAAARPYGEWTEADVTGTAGPTLRRACASTLVRGSAGLGQLAVLDGDRRHGSVSPEAFGAVALQEVDGVEALRAGEIEVVAVCASGCRVDRGQGDQRRRPRRAATMRRCVKHHLASFLTSGKPPVALKPRGHLSPRPRARL